MSKASVITIDHVEVSKGDLEKVKEALKVKDNAEAIKKALDVVVGKIDVTGGKTKPKSAL